MPCGSLGILLGALVAFAVRTLLPGIPATLSPLWVALGVALAVGIFFGYYPANRAANLDRIPSSACATSGGVIGYTGLTRKIESRLGLGGFTPHAFDHPHRDERRDFDGLALGQHLDHALGGGRDSDVQLLGVRLTPVFTQHAVQVRVVGIDLGDAMVQPENGS